MQNRFLFGFHFIFYILYSGNAIANTDIFPIEDVIACHMYVLPAIQGNGLTPSVAYYSSPGGTGTKYVVGDTIHTSRILYAFDQDAMGPDEECFFIQIIDHLPDLSQIGNDTACAYYMLPYFITPSISGFAGYYTMPNAEGVRYQQGDTIFSSVTLYAYDGYESCSVEKKITIVINDPPVFDKIPHQYGCHEYSFILFDGENVFADSVHFLIGNQTFYIDDITAVSGDVEVVAQNGSCITRDTFELSVIDEISIDPPGDTVICGSYFILPSITGFNVTENAKYYLAPGGMGKDYLPGRNYNTNNSPTLYLFDEIPGSDCIDEQFFTIVSTNEAHAWSDFTTTVCKGYQYNVYDLLLARNIEKRENKIYSIYDQVTLEPGSIFNTADYPEGEYLFYVVDSASFPCINDTAIMTILVTSNCTNPDKNEIYCLHNQNQLFLLSTNIIKDKNFVLGGYFLDENLTRIMDWDDNYVLDRSTVRHFRFYYVLSDSLGKTDTAVIVVDIIESIDLQFVINQTVLCKGECTNIRIDFLDDDSYLVLNHLRSAEHQNIFNISVVHDSLNREDDITICYSNINAINNQNPDTLYLPLANHEYYFNVFALNLKECQNLADRISLFTLEENTFFYNEILCPGESVIFEGQEFSEKRPEGEILLNIPATNGCDSFIYVNLSFYQPAINIIREEICDTDTVIINCVPYTSEFSRDTQILSGGGVYGCDSMIIIDLHFSKPDLLTLDTILCENERLIVGDKEFSNEGHYVGIIKKENLCDSIWYDITIHKRLKEDINIQWTGPLCIGDTVIIGIENIYESLTWSTGETTEQILVLLPGEYSVSVTDVNGCLNDTTVLVWYEEELSITGDFYYLGHINEPIQFNLFSDGKLSSIKWHPSNGLDCDTCLAPKATLQQSQSYNFTAINEEGCIDTGIVIVEILLDLNADIYIPNIFNPGSQSGENRIFRIFTKGNSRKYDLSVFDRWGGLVFHQSDLNTNSIDSGWNGKINNTFLPSGVYVYKIVLEDFDIPIIGTITLIQ